MISRTGPSSANPCRQEALPTAEVKANFPADRFDVVRYVLVVIHLIGQRHFEPFDLAVPHPDSQRKNGTSIGFSPVCHP